MGAQFDPNKNNKNFTVSKCNDARCGTCQFIHAGNYINTKSGGKIFANANMNCKSRNLIYCIKYPNCEEIYIGQTGNSLSERMRVHRQQIRNPNLRQIPLSGHLETCANRDFLAFPFYKLHDSSEVKRKVRENKFY